MNVHFISFADGSPSLTAALKRIHAQAEATNWFKTVNMYSLINLINIDRDWSNQHLPFILKNQTGFGYWIWKPFLIYNALKNIPNGEFLIYADAGCEINNQGYDRLINYLEIACNAHLMGFYLTHNIQSYTKSDTLDYFDIIENKVILDSPMYLSGVQIIYKCAKTLCFYKILSETITNKNYSLVDDTQSKIKNSPTFIAHRHDQSIFTLQCKVMELGHFIADETYQPSFKENNYSVKYPFLALRNKTGVSLFN